MALGRDDAWVAVLLQSVPFVMSQKDDFHKKVEKANKGSKGWTFLISGEFVDRLETLLVGKVHFDEYRTF